MCSATISLQFEQHRTEHAFEERRILHGTKRSAKKDFISPPRNTNTSPFLNKSSHAENFSMSNPVHLRNRNKTEQRLGISNQKTNNAKRMGITEQYNKYMQE